MGMYSIKAHPTIYKGVQFRSRLEARWAAFFDLIGWKWEYEPIDLKGWTPDFLVTFPCNHSECSGNHTLLVEIKPYFNLHEFKGHPYFKYSFANPNASPIPADSSATFGINPSVTEWDMAHGCGCGTYSIKAWVEFDVDELWNQAGALVQWYPAEQSHEPELESRA